MTYRTLLWWCARVKTFHHVLRRGVAIKFDTKRAISIFEIIKIELVDQCSDDEFNFWIEENCGLYFMNYVNILCWDERGKIMRRTVYILTQYFMQNCYVFLLEEQSFSSYGVEIVDWLTISFHMYGWFYRNKSNIWRILCRFRIRGKKLR